ncbi:GLPGLI family protein [Aestuariivivens sediminis]|uniref:GLPGLI family protein n=1 Tax=Aestuariivivens sediminis TaxID=2913557 RepID=UPI001F5A70E9|nr:GLPGLI family protein [Aestuariivivens sediminis]
MKQFLTLVFIMSISAGNWAQDFQGIATYKTKRQLHIPLDSTQMNSEMYQRMIEMLKKQFEKTFILTFNKEASVYKEDEKLGAPQTGNMTMMVVSTEGSDVLYKNMKTKRYTSQNELFGKLFLVKDDLEKWDWTLENETKTIGKYTCYKATMTRHVEVIQGGISVNGEKNLNTESHMEPKMRAVKITAWYTPEIPLNNGPARYYGLPGLILEVNDGEETILCSKIVLYPDKDLEIKEPQKGKEVNREDYDAIVERKMQEEQERFNGGRHDGERIEIRIGG